MRSSHGGHLFSERNHRCHSSPVVIRRSHRHKRDCPQRCFWDMTFCKTRALEARMDNTRRWYYKDRWRILVLIFQPKTKVMNEVYSPEFFDNVSRPREKLTQRRQFQNFNNKMAIIGEKRNLGNSTFWRPSLTLHCMAIYTCDLGDLVTEFS